MSGDSVRIILPDGVSPEDFRDILGKSTLIEDHNPSLSFEDGVITNLSVRMVEEYGLTVEDLVEEVKSILSSEYGDV